MNTAIVLIVIMDRMYPTTRGDLINDRKRIDTRGGVLLIGQKHVTLKGTDLRLQNGLDADLLLLVNHDLNRCVTDGLPWIGHTMIIDEVIVSQLILEMLAKQTTSIPTTTAHGERT